MEKHERFMREAIKMVGITYISCYQYRLLINLFNSRQSLRWLVMRHL